MHDPSSDSDPDGAPPPRDPLLLLSDPLAGPAMWDGVAPLLTGGFEVLREAPAGIGDAIDADAPTDRWVESELARRNVYPVHLVGSGFAAGAAVELALRRPELLRSLVLHGPILRLESSDGEEPFWSEVATAFGPVARAIDGGDAVAARRRWRAAVDPRARPADAFEGVAVSADTGQRRWARDWNEGTAGRVGAPEGFDFLPPVLVVDGDGCPGYLRSIADAVAARFPNATRLTLPDATALLPEEEPHRVAAVLFSFCLERNVPSA